MTATIATHLLKFSFQYQQRIRGKNKTNKQINHKIIYFSKHFQYKNYFPIQRLHLESLEIFNFPLYLSSFPIYMHIKKLFSKRKLVLQCIYRTCSAEDSFSAPWQWDLNSVSTFLLEQKGKVQKEKEFSC